MVPSEIRRRFQQDIQNVALVGQTVTDIVLSYCAEQGFAWARREKSLEATSEKLESGRYARWSDLDDRFGCAVIIPTLGEEDDVLRFLSGHFDEQRVVRRTDSRQDPTVFRFNATRFYGTVRAALPTEDSRTRVQFEVQVRTAFEHAWSVTTHSLVYKPNLVDWRLEHLAAKLKASVEQLDMLVSAYNDAANSIPVHSWVETEFQSQFVELFRQQRAIGRIPEDSLPVSLVRTARNTWSLLCKSTGGSIRESPKSEWGTVVVTACTSELQESSTWRSLSIFQFVLGTLIKRGIISAKFKEDYFAMVTSSLLELFPEVEAVQSASRFDPSA